jgi:hypothetical protein
MQIPREYFIDQFAISVRVHSIPLWSRRSKEPPLHVSRSVYEVIQTNRGRLSMNSAGFAEIVHPVIKELHARLPKGERPSAQELTGLIYDALDRAGVEITLQAPVLPHGGGYGRK